VRSPVVTKNDLRKYVNAAPTAIVIYHGGTGSSSTPAVASSGGSTVSGFRASDTPLPYTILALDSSAKFPASVISDDFPTTAHNETITGTWSFTQTITAPRFTGHLTTRWESLTNGDAANPELIFADGDIIACEVTQ
jgi:hypothetical protein